MVTDRPQKETAKNSSSSRKQLVYELCVTPPKKEQNGSSNFRGMMRRNEAYLLAAAGSHFTLRAMRELTSVKSTSVSVFRCPECLSRQSDSWPAPHLATWPSGWSAGLAGGATDCLGFLRQQEMPSWKKEAPKGMRRSKGREKKEESHCISAIRKRRRWTEKPASVGGVKVVSAGYF